MPADGFSACVCAVQGLNQLRKVCKSSFGSGLMLQRVRTQVISGAREETTNPGGTLSALASPFNDMCGRKRRRRGQRCCEPLRREKPEPERVASGQCWKRREKEKEKEILGEMEEILQAPEWKRDELGWRRGRREQEL